MTRSDDGYREPGSTVLLPIKRQETREVPPAVPASLAVIVVSYKHPELLDRCLGSLAKHGPVDEAPLEVWVVDNASGPAVQATIAQHPEVRFAANPTNVGFGAAVNVALARIDAPHVLVLNQDTAIERGTLQTLVDVLARREEVGMIGCRLVKPDGTLDHACRRSFPTLVGAMAHFTGVGRWQRAPARLAQYRAPESDRSGPVEAINGAFMLIRRRALEEVGEFDESYWLYGEDLDLCYRFGQGGWTVWYEPSVTARHVKGASTGHRRRYRENRAFHAAMLRFYRKFEAPRRTPVVNGCVYVAIGAKTIFSLAHSATARGATRLRGRGRAQRRRSTT